MQIRITRNRLVAPRVGIPQYQPRIWSAAVASQVLGSAVSGIFYVEGVLVVHVCETEDREVEPVFCVAVYSAGFSESDGAGADNGV